jgi:uncharacterized protein (DUF4415 family)
MNWFIPLGDFAPVAIPLIVLTVAWTMILLEQRRRRLAAAAAKAAEGLEGGAADGPVRQSLRLSREVLEHFRATGPGWQARIDEVLKRHVRDEGASARRRAAEPEATTARVAEERSGYEAGEGAADKRE